MQFYPLQVMMVESHSPSEQLPCMSRERLLNLFSDSEFIELQETKMAGIVQLASEKPEQAKHNFEEWWTSLKNLFNEQPNCDSVADRVSNYTIGEFGDEDKSYHLTCGGVRRRDPIKELFVTDESVRRCHSIFFISH